MIVFKGTNAWQTNSEYPDTDFLKGIKGVGEHWVVPDDSELALKIKKSAEFEEITDGNGNLTDIVPIPSAEKQTAEGRISELKAQLDEIDKLAIRPLRAIAAGTATDEDRSILAELEMQAEAIRAEMAELSAGKENEVGYTDNKSGT